MATIDDLMLKSKNAKRLGRIYETIVESGSDGIWLSDLVKALRQKYPDDKWPYTSVDYWVNGRNPKDDGGILRVNGLVIRGKQRRGTEFILKANVSSDVSFFRPRKVSNIIGEVRRATTHRSLAHTYSRREK